MSEQQGPHPQRQSHVIAVSAQDGGGLSAQVSGHFGRCPWFTIVRLEDGEPVGALSVVNPAAASHQPGQVPEFVRGQGADIILSGGMGGRAVAMFEQWGIRVATGASGTVAEAVRGWHTGELSKASPCAGGQRHEHDHNHHRGGCHGS